MRHENQTEEQIIKETIKLASKLRTKASRLHKEKKGLPPWKPLFTIASHPDYFVRQPNAPISSARPFLSPVWHR